MDDSGSFASSDGVDVRERETESSIGSPAPEPPAESDFCAEESTSRFARHRSLQDFFEGKSKETIDSKFLRARSNSDGATVTPSNGNENAFPSLSNSVLEKMGLLGDGPKERLNDENLEQKFTSLSLAFMIDAATIKDRCERQRRTRDQTENNLAQELEKLKEKLVLLQPICTDFDSAELLSILLAQVEVITKAVSLVSIAAERYGAVQHEDRLTESVQLMVNHVQALKQQREFARKQLQYTKRVFQDYQDNPQNNSAGQKPFLNPNRKVITRRRASIASTMVPQEHHKPFKRLSEVSFKIPPLAKTARPSRLELTGELLKIKEDSTSESAPEQSGKKSSKVKLEHINGSCKEDREERNESKTIVEKEKIKSKETNVEHSDGFRLSLMNKAKPYFDNFCRGVTDKLRRRRQNDYIHMFFSLCAIICFAVSLLTLVNMYLEYQNTRGSYAESVVSWFWPTSNKANSKYRKRH